MEKVSFASEPQDIIVTAEKTKRIWSHTSSMWMAIDYIVNIFAFCASILTIFIEVLITNNTVLIVSFSTVAATLTFFSFAVNPKHHMRKYRKACEGINAALLCYYNSDGNEINRNNIVDALISGEQLISSTYDVD